MDAPELKSQTAAHQAVFRCVLAEPVVLEQGKWINRNFGGQRGYWLPWKIVELEVTGTWEPFSRGDKLPRWYVRGRGHTVTKAGARGSDYSAGFYGRDPQLPEAFAALRDQLAAEVAAQRNWPL